MTSQITTKAATDCTSLAELRSQIDRIDQAIIALIGHRASYVHEVVRYKQPTAASIEASDRRTSMLVDRRAWAEEAGLAPDVVEQLFSNLVQYFIDEEKKLVNLK